MKHENESGPQRPEPIVHRPPLIPALGTAPSSYSHLPLPHHLVLVLSEAVLSEAVLGFSRFEDWNKLSASSTIMKHKHKIIRPRSAAGRGANGFRP